MFTEIFLILFVSVLIGIKFKTIGWALLVFAVLINSSNTFKRLYYRYTKKEKEIFNFKTGQKIQIDNYEFNKGLLLQNKRLCENVFTVDDTFTIEYSKKKNEFINYIGYKIYKLSYNNECYFLFIDQILDYDDETLIINGVVLYSEFRETRSEIDETQKIETDEYRIYFNKRDYMNGIGFKDKKSNKLYKSYNAIRLKENEVS